MKPPSQKLVITNFFLQEKIATDYAPQKIRFLRFLRSVSNMILLKIFLLKLERNTEMNYFMPHISFSTP